MADLNLGQKDASEAFFTFLFQPGNGFIISGPAGVGKTFLMNHFINVIMPRYFETCKLMGIEAEYLDMTMTATTNKAAEVLAVATGRPTGTIHSFMNLKVTDDYSTGKSILTKTKSWTVHQKKIIFIDEDSMIDTPLFEVLQEGTHQCKIVYVGDHNQLAPVLEKLSPVFKQGYPFFELTEPMRNNGQPALMEVCAQLRKTVETGEFHPIQVVPGVIEHLDPDEMEAALERVFKAQTLESRILAFTNQRVIQYNDHIRTLRSLPDQFVEDEYLINNSAIRLKSGAMLTVEEEITINKIHGKEMISIAHDVEMEVMKTDITAGLGDIHYDVPVPVDRAHYTALVNYFKRAKNWERYFYLKQTFPDLRQRDAATVHKSQGSTYDSVFIDLTNISTCNIANQVARMLYVAFSRPKNKIYLYGNLADKYGGLSF